MHLIFLKIQKEEEKEKKNKLHFQHFQYILIFFHSGFMPNPHAYSLNPGVCVLYYLFLVYRDVFVLGLLHMQEMC